MLRFQDGDQAAFAELYRRHYDAVLKVCRRILNGKTPASDLAHDTFLTAYERGDQWRPQATPQAVRAWFTTIATRKCLDVIRRASTRRAASPTREGKPALSSSPTVSVAFPSQR